MRDAQSSLCLPACSKYRCGCNWISQRTMCNDPCCQVVAQSTTEATLLPGVVIVITAVSILVLMIVEIIVIVLVFILLASENTTTSQLSHYCWLLRLYPSAVLTRLTWGVSLAGLRWCVQYRCLWMACGHLLYCTEAVEHATSWVAPRAERAAQPKAACAAPFRVGLPHGP